MEANVIKYSSKRFSRVWTSGEESELIRELDRTLTEGEEQSYLQTAWMGRGCYKNYGDGFIFLKGVGPTEGGEIFRGIMDKFWKGRSPVQKGGCVRLNTRDFPILIEYFYKSEREIEVFDPRPEGYSIYGAVLREAVISDYLYSKGFYIPRPVAVYRTDLASEWETGNREEMAKYCYDAFLKVMNVPGDTAVNISKIQYEDPKAGLFVRLFDSEIRLQEIVEVYIHHEEKLAELSRELDLVAKRDGAGSWTRMFSRGMIKNLVTFLKYGIIHSNLETHYQNFSLRGEICDWDAAIIHKSFPCASEFKSILKSADGKYDAEMMLYYEEDERAHEDYATFAIRQIYAIINSCMFAERIKAEAVGREWSASDVERVERELICDLIGEADDFVLSELTRLSKCAPDCEYRYKMVGRTSILGWNCYPRHKDYSAYICKESDRLAIVRDVNKMMELIGSAVSERGRG